LRTVATKNSEPAEKARVLGQAAVVSPACLSPCVRSSRCLPADSAVGPFWNSRTSPSVTSCTFFVVSGRGGHVCLRSTACSGSGSTDYGHAVWTRRRWSSRPPWSNGTVRASACVLALALGSGRPSVDRKVRKLIREMSRSASDTW
jgi:hypothetical protein